MMLMWGCWESDLAFRIRYDQVSGLGVNNPVYFEGNKIGRVRQVFYTKSGDYLVEVSIRPEFKNAATVDSTFYIQDDPGSADKKYLQVRQGKPGGQVLERDTVVKGSIEPGLLRKMMSGFMENAELTEGSLHLKIQKLKESLRARSRKMDAGLEHGLDALSGYMQNFKNELQSVPNSNELKELENILAGLSANLRKAQEDIRDSIRYELLPELRNELEHLRECLKKYGRQEEMDAVEERAKELEMI